MLKADQSDRSSSSYGYSLRARDAWLGVVTGPLHINGVHMDLVYYSVQAFGV